MHDQQQRAAVPCQPLPSLDDTAHPVPKWLPDTNFVRLLCLSSFRHIVCGVFLRNNDHQAGGAQNAPSALSNPNFPVARGERHGASRRWYPEPAVSGTALAAGGTQNRRLAPCRSQPAFLAWTTH